MGAGYDELRQSMASPLRQQKQGAGKAELVVVQSIGRLLSKLEVHRRKERNAASHQMHQTPTEDPNEKATDGTQFC